MSEPTRLKALFQGISVGGVTASVLASAFSRVISIALVETKAFEDTLNSFGMAAAVIPTLIGIGIGLPIALFLTSRPFESAKRYSGSFAASALTGAILTRGFLSFVP